MKITKLDWDSTFFNCNMGQIILEDKIKDKEKKKMIQSLSKFDFIAIKNIGNLFDNNKIIGGFTTSYLADINIQYQKKIRKQSESYNDIEIKVSNFFMKDENIVHLALNFEESRFTLDTKFEKKLAQKMYEEWTLNAFGKGDKYFSVAYYENKVVGYLLFSLADDKQAIIELLSVSRESRGKGIGKQLVTKTEEFLYETGVHVLKVGTQSINYKANNFHHSVGFEQINTTSIYHLWNI